MVFTFETVGCGVVFFSHNKIIFELFNPLQVLTVTFAEDKSFFLHCKVFSSALTFQHLANGIKDFACIKTKV